MDDRVHELDSSLPASPASGQDSAAPGAAQQTAVVGLRSVPPLTTSPRRFRVTPWVAGLAALLLVVALAGQREGWLASVSGPDQIARTQIEDLGRGQVRAAYDLFSARYRTQVPFEEWRELTLTHARMFRTRELHLAADQESASRATLEAHLLSESGDRYVARFTLIRAGGQWWVDDLHWAREDQERGRITAERRLTLAGNSA
jgi:hypothetical protein